MTGQWQMWPRCSCATVLFALIGGLMMTSVARAQPSRSQSGRSQSGETLEPIRGITFSPPRAATIRRKRGNLVRGNLIAISKELVHFSVSSGKEFQYSIKTIRTISTNDRDFLYNTAYDTFAEAIEKAEGLAGVTIDASAAVKSGAAPTIAMFPRPPAPPAPRMVDPPSNYEFQEEPIEITRTPRPVAPPPPSSSGPPVPNGGAAGGMDQPIHETTAFKMVCLVGAFAVIGFWWYSKVG